MSHKGKTIVEAWDILKEAFSELVEPVVIPILEWVSNKLGGGDE